MMAPIGLLLAALSLAASPDVGEGRKYCCMKTAASGAFSVFGTAQGSAELHDAAGKLRWRRGHVVTVPTFEVAISSEGNRLALIRHKGSEVVATDEHGRLLWKHRPAETASGVDITADGKRVTFTAGAPRCFEVSSGRPCR